MTDVMAYRETHGLADYERSIDSIWAMCMIFCKRSWLLLPEKGAKLFDEELFMYIFDVLAKELLSCLHYLKYNFKVKENATDKKKLLPSKLILTEVFYQKWKYSITNLVEALGKKLQIFINKLMDPMKKTSYHLSSLGGKWSWDSAAKERKKKV